MLKLSRIVSAIMVAGICVGFASQASALEARRKPFGIFAIGDVAGARQGGDSAQTRARLAIVADQGG
jgi:hypothetical protein